MNKKRILRILLICLMFFLFASVVYAQKGALTDMFDSLFGGMDLWPFYQKYGVYVDLVIYMVVFIGLAESTLGEKFGKSRKLIVGIGILLAVALAVFESFAGFNLLAFGPYAFVLIGLFLAYTIYQIVKNFVGDSIEKKGAAFLIAIGAAIIFAGMFSGVVTSTSLYEKMPPFAKLMFNTGLGMILFIIGIILAIAGRKGGIRPTLGDFGGGIGRVRSGAREFKKKYKEEAAVGKEEEKIDKDEIKVEKKLGKELKRIDNDIANLLKGKKGDKALADISKEMKRIVPQVKKLRKEEGRKFQDENLREHLSTSTGNLHDLLAKERDVFVAFEKLLAQGIAELDQGGGTHFQNAYRCFTSAQQMLKRLIEMDRAGKKSAK